MAIYRNKTQQFTTVSQKIIRDDRLTLKDLGLLVRLLSLPDNWNFSERGLFAIFKQDGSTSIRTGLKNLEKLGYLKREQKREKGKLAQIEWSIYDAPQSNKKPRSENPITENPITENATQYNTNTSITDVSNNKRESKARFTPPTREDVQAYCKERNNKVDAERFIDYYTANGWQVGKNKMKDWKAAVRNWERSERNYNKPTQTASEIDYSLPSIFLD